MGQLQHALLKKHAVVVIRFYDNKQDFLRGLFISPCHGTIAARTPEEKGSNGDEIL
jgi:hypothetical protein